jgi:hypothetical protein
VQQHVLTRDATAAYMSILSLTVMLRQYVTEGEGRANFGERQELVQEAARDLEQELIALGRRFLTPEELQAARATVESFARERPIRRGVAVTQVESALAEVERSDAFRSFIELPLVPFRALEGVGEGAQAIHDFNHTAHGFSAIVATLPTQLRWQAELLLLDLRDLPAELAQGLEGAERPLSQIQQTLQGARELTGPLTETAHAVAEAAEAWRRTIRRDEDRQLPDVAAGPPRPRFDVSEWTAAAAEIGRAADRLGSAAQAVQALIESRQAVRNLRESAEVLAGAERRAREVADHLVERIALAAAGLLTLALVYRLVALRLARRWGPR